MDKVSVLVFLFLFSSGFALGLESEVDQLGSYVDEYDSGGIDAGQLIVYTDYVVSRIRGMSSKTELSESDFRAVLGDSERMMELSQGSVYVEEPVYEKRFSTSDFNIVLGAYPHLASDENLYESSEPDVVYNFGWWIEALGQTDSLGVGRVEDFVEELEDIARDEDWDRVEDLRSEFSEIKYALMNEDFSLSECKDFFRSVLPDSEEDNWSAEDGSGTGFSSNVYVKVDRDCWEEENCEPVCEGGECYPECETVENCNERDVGGLTVTGSCGKGGDGEVFADLSVGGWGELQPLSEVSKVNVGRVNCERRVKGLVRVRRAVQDSVDKGLVSWFVNDFLDDDVERYVNGGEGLRRVLDVLIRNEEELSGQVGCAGLNDWPSGFDKINLEVENEVVELEVWEKQLRTHESEVPLWSTFYRMKFLPPKDIVREVIVYQISEARMSPDQSEVAEMKQDETFMELIERFSKKYGGSFDVMFSLEDVEGVLFTRYLRVNPSVVIGIVEALEEDSDIQITIDYDSLYDFIDSNMGDELRAPYWVERGGEGGFDEFFRGLGKLISFWRSGVRVRPVGSELKLLWNVRDVIGVMSSYEEYEEQSSSMIDKE